MIDNLSLVMKICVVSLLRLVGRFVQSSGFSHGVSVIIKLFMAQRLAVFEL